MNKRVIPRQRAYQDIEAAIEYYLDTDASEAALTFIDALERAFTYLGRHRATGSLRYGHELNLPGLRSWPLKKHPYVIFYIETETHIDIWRILHSHSDIPAWMQGII